MINKEGGGFSPILLEQSVSKAIATKPEVSNPQKPFDILKNRFSLLTPLVIESVDWHEEKRREHWTRHIELIEQKRGLEEGSPERKKLQYQENEAYYKSVQEKYMIKLVSSSEEDDKEIAKAEALHNREYAKKWAYLAKAQDLAVDSPERKKKEDLAEGAVHMAEALSLTISQVNFLVKAESFPVESEDREKVEEKARDNDFIAKKMLYLALSVRWPSERAKKEANKRISASKQGKEIAFPEWLEKEIKDLTNKNKAKMSDEEKQVEPLHDTTGDRVDEKKEDELMQVALKQVERFYPDATEDQKELIISYWLQTKRNRLKEAEKEWDKKVADWTVWAKNNFSSDAPWKKDLPIVPQTKEEIEQQEQQEIELIKKTALQEAYKEWTDPSILYHELTAGGWVAAIVMALKIE